MTSSNHGQYLLDNSATDAEIRLETLAEIFDPVTFRHIEQVGIERGWKCWEVGAGGASVVNWLADRVGPEGRVIATDIDTAHVARAARATVEVLRHDAAADPPPGDDFDLVHARLVLVHVTNRREALRSMVRALRPGGWLLLEDADPALQPLSCLDPGSEEEELANRIRGGFRALMASRGADLAYGRKLPGLLRAEGLCDVGADGWFPVSMPACSRLETATISIIKPQLLAHGVATEEEIERHLANCAAGTLDLAQPPLISAWGRRRHS